MKNVVNEEDWVNVKNVVNVEDKVSVDDGVNVIFSLSSSPLEPFIDMVFDDIEDFRAFYKTYARKKKVFLFGSTILNCQKTR